MKYSEYSVIIVGSGSAGLYSALKISEQIILPDGILLVTKSELGESNSMYAQGGIACVLHINQDDNTKLHINDTIKAGAGLCNPKTVEYISEVSDEVINDLIKTGVNFDKDEAGNLNFTLEAAHSVRRILHSGGDATGKGITQALVNAVKKDKNITAAENTMAVELLISAEKECKGVILYNILTGEHEIAYAPAVILATGGAGQVYKYTTNPDGATGDGIAIAYNSGAKIRDMEFIQFHPTALALSPKSKNRFLISEAVRGEGAKLLNNNGDEFMSRYHDKRELAPRDIVTRAIYSEMQKTHSENVFLNASIIEQKKLFSRFPTITKRCTDNGLDISAKPIPVAPAAHYTMGGIEATVEGKTSIKGLYAIGETANTGLHGANRLASNSLLECVVCAYELADYLSFTNFHPLKMIDENIKQTIDKYSVSIEEGNYNVSNLKSVLKEIMWENVGIIRTEQSLNRARYEISKLKQNFRSTQKCLNAEEYEYRNMLTSAMLIVESAILRRESRGAHCRADFTQTDLNIRHTVLEKNTEKELINA